ncbi:hypothetical protein CEXT_332531 [Caerostris extrusa]|uniref:Uncharacterized protein n=1 Tax=Caerostris extrusa TaxID=172846 RepID=A0AAV4QU70_CAEEX|nr:hypothetical protein CEXT_332531 [Caerostris extrusa]
MSVSQSTNSYKTLNFEHHESETTQFEKRPTHEMSPTDQTFFPPPVIMGHQQLQEDPNIPPPQLEKGLKNRREDSTLHLKVKTTGPEWIHKLPIHSSPVSLEEKNTR